MKDEKSFEEQMAELKAVRQEVDELHEEEAEREKALLPYSDNLPYDRNRVIGEAKFLIKHEIVAKYEIGKRLILLREHESVHTCAHILKENFPGMSRRCAYNYMLFARKVSQLPNLKGFAESGGNWKKCLALLEACDEDELAALEAGESVAGKTLDDVDKMTVRELKRALRKTKPLKDRIVELDAEKRELQAKIDTLTGKKASPKYYYGQLERLDKAVFEAVQIISGFSDEAILKDFDFRIKILSSINTLERVVKNLDSRLSRIINDND